MFALYNNAVQNIFENVTFKRQFATRRYVAELNYLRRTKFFKVTNLRFCTMA